MLPAAHKQRYARHLLLAEIGEAGQERLCAAQVQLPADMDPRAARVARDYLERAGLAIASGGTAAGAFADQAAVQALAGAELLEPAAAALLGSLYAVDQIKAQLRLGDPVQLSADLRLSATSTETELQS